MVHGSNAWAVPRARKPELHSAIGHDMWLKPNLKCASLFSHQGLGGPKVISSLGNWVGERRHHISLREQILWGSDSSKCSPSELYPAHEGPNQSYCCPIPTTCPTTSPGWLFCELLFFPSLLHSSIAFLHKHHKHEVRLFWMVLEGRRLAKYTLSLWRQVQGVASVSSVTQHSRKSLNQGCWD